MDRGVSPVAGTRTAQRHALGALLLAALSVLPTSAQAAPKPITATTTAKATIIAPLSLVKTGDLSFGRIVPRPTAGTVTVDSSTGACTVTGTILQAGRCQQAQFTGMSGGRNANVRISLNSSSNLTGPGAPMVLDGITVSWLSGLVYKGNTNANGQGVGLTSGNGNQRYQSVSSTGVFTFGIGGTLRVNANQAPGVYTGTVSITVQYN